MKARRLLIGTLLCLFLSTLQPVRGAVTITPYAGVDTPTHNLLGVVGGIYATPGAVINTPATTQQVYSFVITDSGGQDIGLISSLSLTLSANMTGSTFAVPYNTAKYDPYTGLGAGTFPKFYLLGSGGNDLTGGVYGQNVAGTILPVGVKSVVVVGQQIPTTFAGGIYNPNSPGEVQSAMLSGQFTIGGQSMSGSATGTVSFVPVPEPTSALLLAIGGAVFVQSRRREMA